MHPVEEKSINTIEITCLLALNMGAFYFGYVAGFKRGYCSGVLDLYNSYEKEDLNED